VVHEPRAVVLANICQLRGSNSICQLRGSNSGMVTIDLPGFTHDMLFPAGTGMPADIYDQVMGHSIPSPSDPAITGITNYIGIHANNDILGRNPIDLLL
jgi:hypothetical protein